MHIEFAVFGHFLLEKENELVYAFVVIWAQMSDKWSYAVQKCELSIVQTLNKGFLLH